MYCVKEYLLYKKMCFKAKNMYFSKEYIPFQRIYCIKEFLLGLYIS